MWNINTNKDSKLFKTNAFREALLLSLPSYSLHPHLHFTTFWFIFPMFYFGKIRYIYIYAYLYTSMHIFLYKHAYIFLVFILSYPRVTTGYCLFQFAFPFIMYLKVTPQPFGGLILILLYVISPFEFFVCAKFFRYKVLVFLVAL